MLDLFLPGRRLAFESSLGLEEITRRLQHEITAPARPSVDRRPHLFQGAFGDGQFRIMRSVRGRNSFNPVVTGQLSSGGTGTRIDVQLQLHPLVLILLAIFALIAGTIASIAASEMLVVTGSGLTARVLVMLLLTLLSAAIANMEAKKTINLLSRVFDVEPILPIQTDVRRAL